MKIIVLNKTDYQDKDTIIDAISETGSVSFKVRSGQTPNCHVPWINNPLVVADVEYVDNPRYRNKILKGAKLLFYPLDNIDYDSLLEFQLAREIIDNILLPEEKFRVFNDLLDYLTACHGRKNNLLKTLMFMARAIQYSGSGLVVDRCVFCGSTKDIVSFSFADGGFICRECMHEGMPIDLSPYQMKLIRALFTSKISADIPEDNVKMEDKEWLLMKLTQYVSDANGARLNTTKLILDNLRK